MIIKKADKGNRIVVEDTETYITIGENHLSDKRTFTRRYIDDIFMIWTHGRDSLETFLCELNTFHHSIEYTFDISNTEAAFLDVTAHKCE